MSRLGEPVDPSRCAAERAARAAYGRLVALVVSRGGDVAAAEDALSEAFVAALERWPHDGVPRAPEAWLLQVARRRQVDDHRRRAVRDRARPTLSQLAEEAAGATPVPERRLGLLFLCAHPAIDAGIRSPLMLQTVLGLSAQQIGEAFLVSGTTMGQRLSRAKQKIRSARVPFEVPASALAERRGAVCEAIYAAFSTGYAEESARARHGLVDEAIWLARLLHEQTDEDPEAAGLLALMLHIDARRSARRDAAGRYVPLERQDCARWDRTLISEAESLLWRASTRHEAGRFQLEAAIQSAHAHRLLTGRTDWTAVEILYRRLLRHADTLGARVAHVAALAEVAGPEVAWGELSKLDPEVTRTHQAYWALRAHLERELGRDAKASTEAALALTRDPAVRAFLLRDDD